MRKSDESEEAYRYRIAMARLLYPAVPITELLETRQINCWKVDHVCAARDALKRLKEEENMIGKPAIRMEPTMILQTQNTNSI